MGHPVPTALSLRSQFLPNERCNKALPVGCIYEEFLLKNDLVNEISLNQNANTTASMEITEAIEISTADPTDCQGCNSVDISHCGDGV